MPEIETTTRAQVENAMTTIEAAANVILRLCEDQLDIQPKFEAIAYTAAIILHQANAPHERLNLPTEACHG